MILYALYRSDPQSSHPALLGVFTSPTRAARHAVDERSVSPDILRRPWVATNNVGTMWHIAPIQVDGAAPDGAALIVSSVATAVQESVQAYLDTVRTDDNAEIAAHVSQRAIRAAWEGLSDLVWNVTANMTKES